MANTEESGFISAIKENPGDMASRLAYADWLEDQGRSHDALQQRVKAGVSQLCYKLRRKSDGLFSDCDEEMPGWSTGGKQWRRLGDVRGHFTRLSYLPKYGGNTSWDDLEVVLFEVRTQAVAVLTVSRNKSGGPQKVVIHEPQDAGNPVT
jgi:uncharacterized protein (TIGR02996 family)